MHEENVAMLIFVEYYEKIVCYFIALQKFNKLYLDLQLIPKSIKHQ